MWAAMTDEELIRQSDLVVMGEWLGQGPVKWSPTAAPTELGVIRVREALKPAAGVQPLAFVALPRPTGLLSGSDLNFKPGDHGLWLLRALPGMAGLHAVDHPQRFVPLATGAAKISELRRLLAAR